MEVKVLRQTEQPERLVCQAGRGDYYEGYIGDTEYEELMEGVSYDEDDVERAIELSGINPDSYHDNYWENNAAPTLSFIEKQLSRGHYGLWEHPQITFTVKGVSRVTMAQITRHRHLSFDVQSMRYADFSEQEIVVPATLLSDEARHERYPHIYDEDGDHFNRDEGVFEMSEEKRTDWRSMFVQHKENMRDFYQSMVEAGIPKEDARFILPLGTTVNMTFSGNARTFLHLLDMRKKANAQWEIRELSEALLDELFEWAPYTFNYYAEHGPNKLSP
jgi:thymidylate synthase (FAD)